ncbi:acyl-CoA dehydrogenase family protein [Caballeronia sp. INDeC2]|uniref:acyl-CoA dehydrogenase family protein n=1 Tax=Caballeronia sp. INDeC2 TaxID=2921747 RepID=UPI0020285B34|nr:acyl-CoA dehydrogenase family protein [Caballeronia sp. INDeC2]
MTYRVPTEEQTLAVKSFRKFLLAEVRPVAHTYRHRFIPKATMRELTQRIAEFGLPGCTVPVEHGGMGWSYTTQGMLLEELAACSCDVALCVMLNMAVAEMLLDAAPELRARYLPETLGGRLFGAIGICELEIGPNGAEIPARAVRDGDHFTVNGTQSWITNGVYSDVLVCAVRTEKGLSHLLIDREAHGYETRNIDRVALNAQSTAQIFIADASVPATHLLGQEGEGLRDMKKFGVHAGTHVGVLSVGLMRAALDESIAYATKHTQFGKIIAARPLIAAKLADMAIRTDAARLMYQRVFGMRDAGLCCDVQASMALGFATEAAVQVCRDAVQLHGANGVTREFDVERLLREAMTMSILGGVTEIPQLGIARALTGVAAFD